MKLKHSPRSRLWVGVRANVRSVFRAVGVPTHDTHGNLYTLTIGPFRTRAGADFMANSGAGNPHVQCVADAERIAARLKREKLNGGSAEVGVGNWGTYTQAWSCRGNDHVSVRP